MRLLFVGFNREYVNRTLSILLRAVRAHHTLDMFGPGFQQHDVVARGPERWLEAHGPYDLVLFESYVFEHDAVAVRERPFAGDCLRMRRQDFFTQGPALQAFVLRYSGAKVFISNWDVYSVSQDRVRQLDESGAYICDGSMSRFTIEEKQQMFGGLHAVGGESRGFVGGRGTDNWLNFLRARRQRLLEVPHCIGLEQTSFTPLISRPVQFAVPGTSYRERKDVYGLLTLRQRGQQVIDRVAAKLHGLRDTLSPSRIRQLHAQYDDGIARSRLAFTSGSVYRSAVRKYFEIPALGAVPVGQVVEGFDDLGFKNGHNFVVAETPGDVRRVIFELKDDDAQVIASRARQFVIDTHSEPARARQLAESFARISNGTFRGSYWSNGSYEHR